MLAVLPGWAGPILAAAISATGTALAIGYARRRALLDLPGRRRSHTLPTPRGGGIGIVAAAFVCFCLPLLGEQVVVAGTIVAALLLVAAIGWWDDHSPLGALPRLAVQCAAAVFVAIALVWLPGLLAPTLVYTLAAFVALTIVWSINLHNFMDGINGLLAMQAAFVFAALGVADVVANHWQAAWSEWSLAAACLAFLPFNFPRARVFMGDVGSGSLGLLIAAAVWFGVEETGPARIWTGLALGSAFIVDASCTLLTRMTRGRRWYSAHREHLYQWLVRSGRSHAQVVGIYMTWNLLVSLPAAMLIALGVDVTGFAAIGACALGVAVWFAAKSACLRQVRHG